MIIILFLKAVDLDPAEIVQSISNILFVEGVCWSLMMNPLKKTVGQPLAVSSQIQNALNT